MKKRLFSLLLAAALLAGLCLPASAAVGDNGAFVTLRVPYPEGAELLAGDYRNSDKLMARYADDKTPIPLSAYYDGNLFATVPAANAGREIEAFLAGDVEFTDYDPSEYVFVTMERLAYTGVIRGNDKEEAQPFANVTRAEAVAMIMRMLGLEASEGTDSGFADVPEDAWYAGVVTAARKHGIVEGDSATAFIPGRNVSRQECIAMIARALWYTGHQVEQESVTAADLAPLDFHDVDQIAAWALSAYETVGSYCVIDGVPTEELDAEGTPVYVRLANPQQAATRHEIADMILNAINYLQIYPSQAAIDFGFDQAMPVVDGSTSTYPFTEEVYRGLFSGGWNHPDRPAAHSKSHASYERLISGEVDMLFASARPTQDIFDLAAEKGVELEFVPIAHDAMVFFTNADNPAEGLTSEQIREIYVNNAYENWLELGGPDAALYPYCRNDDSGSHAHMEKYFLNGGEIHELIKAETTSLTMSNVLTDVMSARTEDPLGYGLGYSIYYYFLSMDMFYGTLTELKLLEIDGAAPSDETIADGTYPLAHNAYVVLRADTPEDAPARKMAEFMLTPAGQQCVELAGYGSVIPAVG